MTLTPLHAADPIVRPAARIAVPAHPTPFLAHACTPAAEVAFV